MTDLSQRPEAHRVAELIWVQHVRFGGQTLLQDGAERIEWAGGRSVWIAAVANLIQTEANRP